MSARLTAVAEGEEVVLEIPRRGRAALRVPMWFVVVEGRIYVRAYRGDGSLWFRSAMHAARATASFSGRTLDVSLTRQTDPATNRRISRAYLDKYARHGYAASIVSPAAAGATMELHGMLDA